MRGVQLTGVDCSLSRILGRPHSTESPGARSFVQAQRQIKKASHEGTKRNYLRAGATWRDRKHVLNYFQSQLGNVQRHAWRNLVDPGKDPQWIEKRLRADRRSGVDSRPTQLQQLEGERRTGFERRPIAGGRSKRNRPLTKLLLINVAVAFGGLVMADMYFFGGSHSVVVAEDIARNADNHSANWTSQFFAHRF